MRFHCEIRKEELKMNKFITLGLMALLVVSMSGCGSNSSSGMQQGTLGVSLTDAPTTADFVAVNVTVTKVRVHQSATASENDPGWTEITLNPAKKINLLKLTNGVLEDLGQTPLSAGHFTQLRLVLLMNTGASTANSVVLSSDPNTEIPLITPSAVQSGIKLIHEFDVAPGQRVDLVLDFDALKSIVTLGNGGGYLLKPVITVVPTVLTGIEGFVDRSLLDSINSNNVMVSSQVSGTVIRSTVPDPNTGEFFIDHLEARDYDVVITADGHATKVISGVPVPVSTNSSVVTMVSTSTEPITLPTSTMHTIGGAVNLSTGPSPTIVASVVTMQTLTSGGPTVSLKSQNVSPLPGGYSIALPSGAPLLGQFGTGSLPIAFTAQPAIAGKYDVEASADGFTTQSALSVDISTTDVLNLNFTLSP
jgi:hypothetical protein